MLHKTDGYLLDRLQNVQFAAARLVAGIKKRDGIDDMAVLEQMHWLPIRQRIVYKIALLVYKYVNGMGPSYLCDLITPYEPTRNLRSSNALLLKYPDHRSEIGRRAFSYTAPEVWEDIPHHVKKAPSLDTFKHNLKSYLFTIAYKTPIRK